MMRVDEIVEAIGALRRSDLDAWISEELISLQEENGALVFSDMECARIRLICTLRYELEIDSEALPVILSLVDQLYQTRRSLLSLTAAVAAQDRSVQAAILAAIHLDGDIDENAYS
jgi:chaperone modulatory protein CbpM